MPPPHVASMAKASQTAVKMPQKPSFLGGFFQRLFGVHAPGPIDEAQERSSPMPTRTPGHRFLAPGKSILKLTSTKTVHFKVEGMATCLETGDELEMTPNTLKNKERFQSAHQELRQMKRAMDPDSGPSRRRIVFRSAPHGVSTVWPDEADNIMEANIAKAKVNSFMRNREALQSGLADFAMYVTRGGTGYSQRICDIVRLNPDVLVATYTGGERYYARRGGDFDCILIPCSRYEDPSTSMSGAHYILDSSSDSDSSSDDLSPNFYDDMFDIER